MISWRDKLHSVKITSLHSTTAFAADASSYSTASSYAYNLSDCLVLDYQRQTATSRQTTSTDIQHSSPRATNTAWTLFSIPRPTSTYPRLTMYWIKRDIDQSSLYNIRVHIFERLQLYFEDFYSELSLLWFSNSIR